MDAFGQSERWGVEYMGLKGQRVRVKLREQPDFSEVLWLLGQEHDYLIMAREERQEVARRQLSYINTDSILEFEPLATPAFLAGATPNLVEALYVQARVAVHALTPSGSRGLLEITELDPRYGGFFANANWALGFVLRHLHAELQEQGMVPAGEVPLRPDWRGIPSKIRTGWLGPEEQPAASMVIHVAEMPGDQLAAVTVPTLRHPRPGRLIASPNRVRAWGYEMLWDMAVDRRLIPTERKPKVKWGAIRGE